MLIEEGYAAAEPYEHNEEISSCHASGKSGRKLSPTCAHRLRPTSGRTRTARRGAALPSRHSFAKRSGATIVEWFYDPTVSGAEALASGLPKGPSQIAPRDCERVGRYGLQEQSRRAVRALAGIAAKPDEHVGEVHKTPQPHDHHENGLGTNWQVPNWT